MGRSLLSGAVHPEYVSVTQVDPELGEALDEDRLLRSQRASRAVVVRRDCGTWHAKRDADLARDGMGLLVTQGVLVRRVGAGDKYAAELLSVGDLLQPSQHDGEDAMLPFEASWRVLVPLCAAVLDLDWMRRMADYPEVIASLSNRVMIRSRRLASQLAIAQRHRLDDRLMLLFWELADRYGRVCPQGVRLDVDLTHDLISHLVGAHRPSVSVALGRLERSGRVTRENGSWLLHGHEPDPIEALRASADDHR